MWRQQATGRLVDQIHIYVLHLKLKWCQKVLFPHLHLAKMHPANSIFKVVIRYWKPTPVKGFCMFSAFQICFLNNLFSSQLHRVFKCTSATKITCLNIIGCKDKAKLIVSILELFSKILMDSEQTRFECV